MTKDVGINITFMIGNEKRNKLYFKSSPCTLGDDLKYIQQSLTAKISSVILLHLDNRIRETEMKGMKVLKTEKRTIGSEKQSDRNQSARLSDDGRETGEAIGSVAENCAI